MKNPEQFIISARTTPARTNATERVPKSAEKTQRTIAFSSKSSASTPVRTKSVDVMHNTSEEAGEETRGDDIPVERRRPPGRMGMWRKVIL